MFWPRDDNHKPKVFRVEIDIDSAQRESLSACHLFNENEIPRKIFRNRPVYSIAFVLSFVRFIHLYAILKFSFSDCVNTVHVYSHMLFMSWSSWLMLNCYHDCMGLPSCSQWGDGEKNCAKCNNKHNVCYQHVVHSWPTNKSVDGSTSKQASKHERTYVRMHAYT